MKKLLVMLMVAGIFSLVACGPSEEEKAKAEAEAAAMVDEMFNAAGEETTTEEEVVAEETPAEEEAPVEEAPAQ
ncbi:MAG: hypothetical protein COX70_03310 [Flavobacteriales bacterium CG_4_10_14_0_2_um_filter_32_8]|nr:MAG: hypothetical protein COX70_03310 [Flavobacteriales bacterium CG_4_10_14_0_2_um_filter_32_8]PJB15913.1 MAG: hypothetical protein CO118_01700 [Flavobacteriales bacterium CG_4_9_14_3_um_filter_32_8]